MKGNSKIIKNEKVEVFVKDYKLTVENGFSLRNFLERDINEIINILVMDREIRNDINYGKLMKILKKKDVVEVFNVLHINKFKFSPFFPNMILELLRYINEENIEVKDKTVKRYQKLYDVITSKRRAKLSEFITDEILLNEIIKLLPTKKSLLFKNSNDEVVVNDRFNSYIIRSLIFKISASDMDLDVKLAHRLVEESISKWLLPSFVTTMMTIRKSSSTSNMNMLINLTYFLLENMSSEDIENIVYTAIKNHRSNPNGEQLAINLSKIDRNVYPRISQTYNRQSQKMNNKHKKPNKYNL